MLQILENTGGSFQYPGGGFSWVPELHNRPVLGLFGACLGAVLGLFWMLLVVPGGFSGPENFVFALTTFSQFIALGESL